MPPVILVAIVGALANRFSGQDNVRWLPGRNVYYSILAIGLLSAWTMGPLWSLWITASFAIYRLPGWYNALDIGRDADGFWRDFAIMTLRHLYWAPVFLWRAWETQNWGLLGLLVFGALVSTAIYAWGHWLNADRARGHTMVELLVGGWWGVLIGGMANV